MRMLSEKEADAVGRLLRDIAATEVMPRWRKLRPQDISTKSSPDDLVTIADQRAEAALSAELTRLFPGSRVVGEETFAIDPACLDHLGQDAPAWIIDPIDGTGAFTRGETSFGSMVALVQGQDLLAGWILQPVTGDLYLGQRGGGVRRIKADGTEVRLAPRPPADPAAMTGIVSGWVHLDDTRIVRERLRGHFHQVRPMSCPAMDYPTMLRGEVHFVTYQKCLPWDHLPGLMLLAEAGYAYAKLDGTPYRVGDTEGGVMCTPTRESWATIRHRLIAAQGG